MRREGMTGLRFSPGAPEASDVDLRSRVVRIVGEGTTRAGPAHRGHDRSDPRFQALSGGKRQHGHGGSRATTRSCYLRRRSNSPALVRHARRKESYVGDDSLYVLLCRR